MGRGPAVPAAELSRAAWQGPAHSSPRRPAPPPGSACTAGTSAGRSRGAPPSWTSRGRAAGRGPGRPGRKLVADGGLGLPDRETQGHRRLARPSATPGPPHPASTLRQAGQLRLRPLTAKGTLPTNLMGGVPAAPEQKASGGFTVFTPSLRVRLHGKGLRPIRQAAVAALVLRSQERG